jgi:chemotaxis protein CheX
LDAFQNGTADSQPAAGASWDEIVQLFITAACAAVGEMARTDLVVRGVCRAAPRPAPGDLAAVVRMQSATERFLVLRFPRRSAEGFAGRIMAEAGVEVGEDLVRDCVGEIANVVAGQAKALLAGTASQLTCWLPTVMDGTSPEFPPQQGLDCLVVAFGSDLGEFDLQLFMKL